MRVGYIGLGSLGGPIARRIAASGFALTVHDIAPQAVAALTDIGATSATDPLSVAAASDVLCLCVRTDGDVRDVIGDGALFAALGSGAVLVIQSTIDPALCRELATEAALHGVAVVDCGVSGGAPAALDGTLALYVGGDEDAVASIAPLLGALGSFRHLGPIGRGMEGKLLNNLISIANYGMSAHILNLGELLGFDQKALHAMLMAGSAQSFALKVVLGFTAPDRVENLRTLFEKDVEHCRRLADADLPAMRALMPAAQSMIDLLAARQRG